MPGTMPGTVLGPRCSCYARAEVFALDLGVIFWANLTWFCWANVPVWRKLFPRVVPFSLSSPPLRRYAVQLNQLERAATSRTNLANPQKRASSQKRLTTRSTALALARGLALALASGKDHLKSAANSHDMILEQNQSEHLSPGTGDLAEPERMLVG
jgi:hypothetical protein